MVVRLSLALLESMAALVPPLAAQAVGQRSPEEIRASYDAHQGDFDYLLGDGSSPR